VNTSPFDLFSIVSLLPVNFTMVGFLLSFDSGRCSALRRRRSPLGERACAAAAAALALPQPGRHAALVPCVHG